MILLGKVSYFIVISLIVGLFLAKPWHAKGQNRYMIFRNSADSLRVRYLDQPSDLFDSFVKAVSVYEDSLEWHFPVLKIHVLRSPVLKSFKKNYLVLEDFYRFAANYALSRPDDSMALVYTKKLISYNPYYKSRPDDEQRIEDFIRMLYPLPDLSLGIIFGGSYTDVYKHIRYSPVYIHEINDIIQGQYSFLPGYHVGMNLEFNPTKNLSIALEPGYIKHRVRHELSYQKYLEPFTETGIPIKDNNFNMGFDYLGIPLVFRYHFVRNFDQLRTVYDAQVNKLESFLSDSVTIRRKVGRLERKKEIKDLTSLYTPFKKWIPYVLLGGKYKYRINASYATIDIPSILQDHHVDITGGAGIRKYYRTSSISMELRASYGLNKLNKASSRFSNQTMVFSDLDAMNDIWTYSFELNIIYLFNLSHKAYEIR